MDKAHWGWRSVNDIDFWDVVANPKYEEPGAAQDETYGSTLIEWKLRILREMIYPASFGFR